jgi:hypothetical protein
MTCKCENSWRLSLAFQTIKVKPPERKPTMMFFKGRVPFLDGIYVGFPFWPVPWIE